MKPFGGGTHMPLKGWQQAAVAVGSAFGTLMNLARADLITALGETTEKPRVISSAIGHAWSMPKNTFGAEYAKFMGSRNFSPDDRPPVHFMDTKELAYVANRAREVHDFWHVLFGLPPNLIGESSLKVIELQLLHLSMCLLSIIGGSLRMNTMQGDQFLKHYLPWAIRAGMNYRDIMFIYYEKHFDKDLEAVHKDWA